MIYTLLNRLACLIHRTRLDYGLTLIFRQSSNSDPATCLKRPFLQGREKGNTLKSISATRLSLSAHEGTTVMSPVQSLSPLESFAMVFTKNLTCDASPSPGRMRLTRTTNGFLGVVVSAMGRVVLKDSVGNDVVPGIVGTTLTQPVKEADSETAGIFDKGE